ncbi:hypothetical protein AAFF_G00117910 [Aldrovandia affinis]|uniref:Mitochondrial transcription termination factor 4 n=1 Tax=Aldrovandia affinis TaxID=143900 RepID=A0AAD7RSG0_9TELE|nr:hypothetical protein AAFF_G00117910 [Aldrovandia affinis]
MAAGISGKLVLLWTFRGARAHLCCGRNPFYLTLHDKQQTVSLYRSLCSRHDQNLEPTAVREEMVGSLVNMGFTEPQVEQLTKGALSSRTDRAVNQHLSTVSALVALGFNPSSVLKILDKCPELYRVKGVLLQQRVDNLRKLGLMEGSLQRVISHYPQLLTLPLKRVNGVSRFLREKCLLTVQQVTDILRDSPSVVLEDTGRLEHRVQYAYFRMGIQQAEMVRSGLFRVSLEEVRCRHSFLERRGLYQTPDKKGYTSIVNPKLKDFLTVPEDTFLRKVALATREEFEVFRKLMEREMQGEEEPESSNSEEEDEDGYESEDRRRMSYRRRKK